METVIDERTELLTKVLNSANFVRRILTTNAQKKTFQYALEKEFECVGLNYIKNFRVPVVSNEIRTGNRPIDFLIDGKVAIEIVLNNEVDSLRLAQIQFYLKDYNLKKALILIFEKDMVTAKPVYNDDYDEFME